MLDRFAPISLLDAVIPFVSPYRPLWLGLGTLSFDLLVALVITSLLRRRLGYRAWRAIHWLAYASWPVAVLHGLGTGSDSKAWWMLALTAACVAAVLVAVLARIASARAGRLRRGAGHGAGGRRAGRAGRSSRSPVRSARLGAARRHAGVAARRARCRRPRRRRACRARSRAAARRGRSRPSCRAAIRQRPWPAAPSSTSP